MRTGSPIGYFQLHAIRLEIFFAYRWIKVTTAVWSIAISIQTFTLEGQSTTALRQILTAFWKGFEQSRTTDATSCAK
jgi:hypothetical protein